MLLFLLENCDFPTKTTHISSYSTVNLQNGDIILRKSYGLISEIVVAKLKDTLDISHCGIIQKDSTGKLYVIHCLSKKVSDTDGVQICTLEYFMNDSRIESVHIVRFRPDTNNIIISKAKYYLKHKTPFDELYNASDSSAFFCSEFPIHIIKSGLGIDISSGSQNPKFSIFLNKKYFDEIEFVKGNKNLIKKIR